MKPPAAEYLATPTVMSAERMRLLAGEMNVAEVEHTAEASIETVIDRFFKDHGTHFHISAFHFIGFTHFHKCLPKTAIRKYAYFVGKKTFNTSTP